MIDQVPEGWARIRLGDVFDCWGGMTPSTSVAAYWGGSTPWISSKDVKDSVVGAGTEHVTDRALAENRLRKCPPGSVLVVVRSGVLAHTLPVAVASREVVVNQDLKVLDAGDPELNAWAALHIRASQQPILEANRKDGTTVQSIRVPELLNRELPVAPLAEQRRIVARVEALMEQVRRAKDRLDRVPLILKRFRQAVLGSACAGRLTEDWRLSHRDIRPAVGVLGAIAQAREGHGWRQGPIEDPPDEPRYNELPDSWGLCRVADFATVCSGGTPSRKEPRFWNGDVPWVSSGEVANCRISRTEETITAEGFRDSNAKMYPPGTVLIAMIGEGKTRGQAAILDIDACTNQNSAGLIFDSGHVVPEYVWYWALSRYERTRAGGRGGNQPALNGRKVRGLPVPFPPTEEQAEIVRRVDAMFVLADAIDHRVTTATVRADKLDQSILAKAFRGELVPTEAELARVEGREFESAEELLSRIRRARGRASGTARRVLGRERVPRGR